MINQEKITEEWLAEVSKKHHKVDKILVEKVIRALLLLEGLAKTNINFVFKGGTALMLLLNSTKRLSLDIDIILPQEVENIDDILNDIAINQGFTHKELQERDAQTKIKKVHCKFFYTPLFKTNKNEDAVLLDVLFEKINYNQLLTVPIESSFIPTESKNLNVKIPNFNNILGDKLTAFAPNTTGIPYFKHGDSMSMEIIKQLYDIGNLFDKITDLEEVRTVFERFAQTELSYRNNTDTTNDVLEDIFQTALCIVVRGTDGNGNFEELQKGIQRIVNLIFSENYRLEKAINHAAKAAYLATLIKYKCSEIERYNENIDMSNFLISEPLNTKLNKLKKTDRETFFYWYKIFEIICQNPIFD